MRLNFFARYHRTAVALSQGMQVNPHPEGGEGGRGKAEDRKKPHFEEGGIKLAKLIKEKACKAREEVGVYLRRGGHAFACLLAGCFVSSVCAFLDFF